MFMDMDERIIKDSEYDELQNYKKWYLELLEVIYEDAPEGTNERPDPRIVVRNLRKLAVK